MTSIPEFAFNLKKFNDILNGSICSDYLVGKNENSNTLNDHSVMSSCDGAI